jgi:hypothetical protein
MLRTDCRLASFIGFRGSPQYLIPFPNVDETNQNQAEDDNPNMNKNSESEPAVERLNYRKTSTGRRSAGGTGIAILNQPQAAPSRVIIRARARRYVAALRLIVLLIVLVSGLYLVPRMQVRYYKMQDKSKTIKMIAAADLENKFRSTLASFVAHSKSLSKGLAVPIRTVCAQNRFGIKWISTCQPLRVAANLLWQEWAV